MLNTIMENTYDVLHVNTMNNLGNQLCYKKYNQKLHHVE